MNVAASHSRRVLTIAATCLVAVGVAVIVVFIAQRRSNARLAVGDASVRSQSVPATRPFTRLGYREGVRRRWPGIELLLEDSSLAKRDYAMMVVGPPDGRSMILMDVELSYGGRVVYRGNLTDHIGPYTAHLINVRFSEDVTSYLESDRPGWGPPIITKFEAALK